MVGHAATHIQWLWSLLASNESCRHRSIKTWLGPTTKTLDVALAESCTATRVRDSRREARLRVT